MSDQFYSVVKGEENPSDVTRGTSTSSEAIELRVVDGSGITKTQLLLGIEAIKNFIIRDNARAQ